MSQVRDLGGQLVAMREGTELKYLHQDHLSSTSVMTDDSGDSLGAIKYLPYGETRSGSVPTDKQFTGQRLDSTGLYYYNARYYDPLIGRFISADPIIPSRSNPQTFNHYTYAGNNPLIYVDPSGLDYIIVGGNGSTAEEIEFWLTLLEGLLEEGEEVIFLEDIDSNNLDIAPRMAQVSLYLFMHPDLTDIKLIGHSEGAATVGQLMALFVDNPGMFGDVGSEIVAAFLLDCPTGIAEIAVGNFDDSVLDDLGRALSNRGIKSAFIYNSTSMVSWRIPSGWGENVYNVASFWDNLAFGAGTSIGPLGIAGIAANAAANHSAIKHDAIPVIESIMVSPPLYRSSRADGL